MESDLDSDISSIRAESKHHPITLHAFLDAILTRAVRALQSRKRFLSSSLLSSDALQKHLPNPSIPIPPSSLESQSQSQLAEASPLVQSANTHSESNHHRIAFSTTAFPFTDPSPYGSSGRGKDSEKEHEKNLLGVRIDVCARNGRFVRPFYVLLKRVTGHDGQRRLRIHRHTIPAFISMQKLE